MQTPIAALCYFCENHGPRIVFTCQLIKNAELNIEKQSRKNLSEISSGENNNNDMPQFYGDIYGDDPAELVDDEPRCAACSSFDPGMGLISNDHEAEISFVSTQVPINERLNHLLKQSSLRSLSVEVSAPLFTAAECRQKLSSQLSSQSKSSTSQPYENGEVERDGVVLFGDDENWYTLSYTFRLKDAKARGFHRSYSLVVVCVDKLLLLKNYDFLIKTLCRIVGKLQELTNEFFAFEQQKNSDLRLASNIKGAHWPLHQFYPKHCDLDTSRSLKIITNDENIFTFFHRKMVAMMKTMTSLDKDIVLEGCPTQDMLIAMELNNSGTLEEKELLVSQLSPKQSILQMSNLRWIANKLIGINQTMLILFIWQLVIGEQMVVKCDHLAIRRFFLLACVHFLPIGCVQLATNSEKYFYSYKYNFLGCSLSMEIPEDAQAELFQISLLLKNQDGIEGGKMNSLECFEFRVDHFPKRVEAEKPSIVTRFVQLLMDPLVNDFTLESALRATRNDWLNKAKLIFQMRHQRETTVDLNEVMRIIKCRQQDSPVILFWQKGLSKRYKQVVLNTAAKHLPSKQNSNSTKK